MIEEQIGGLVAIVTLGALAALLVPHLWKPHWYVVDLVLVVWASGLATILGAWSVHPDCEVVR